MVRFSVFLGAVLAAAILVYPASAERGSWNNWHVHDGAATVYTDPSGLTHRGLSIFPQIFAGYSASTPSLWVYCTDATDKALVGGDGGAKGAAGQCQNDTYIVHLQNMASTAPAPTGWTALAPSGGSTFYYRLTPR